MYVVIYDNPEFYPEWAKCMTLYFVYQHYANLFVEILHRKAWFISYFHCQFNRTIINARRVITVQIFSIYSWICFSWKLYNQDGLRSWHFCGNVNLWHKIHMLLWVLLFILQFVPIWSKAKLLVCPMQFCVIWKGHKVGMGWPRFLTLTHIGRPRFNVVLKSSNRLWWVKWTRWGKGKPPSHRSLVKATL